MDVSENYQFNYRKLLKFLLRIDRSGYMFVMADDHRFIRQINTALQSDLQEKNITAKVVFLRKDDTSLLHQIQNVSDEFSPLIIANLYEIINNTADGLNYLLRLNFAREELRQLPAPVLFWVDAASLNIISNQAPDLFSQRRFTTVHFTGKIENPVQEALEKPDWKEFISTTKFKETEAKIETLKRRLKDAEQNSYNATRTANEIALPLAKEYAALGLKEKTITIISKYKSYLDEGSSTQMAQLAQVYYLLHSYPEAIETMQKANDLIEKTSYENDNKAIYNLDWFYNTLDLSDWMQEYGLLNEALLLVKKAAETLANSLTYFSYEWGRDFIGVFKEREGNIYESLGNKEKAIDCYQQSLSIRKDLLEKNSSSDRLKRIISISYINIGDMYQELGNMTQAKDYFEQSLAITQALEKKNAEDEQIKRDLTIAYGRLGDIFRQLSNLEQAKQEYEQGLSIAFELEKNNPNREEPKRDVAAFLDRLGNVFVLMGDLQAGKSYYEQSLSIRNLLMAENPQSELVRTDVAVSYTQLSSIEEEQKNTQQALDYIHLAHSVFQDLSAANPLSQRTKDYLTYTTNKIASLSATTEA